MLIFVLLLLSIASFGQTSLCNYSASLNTSNGVVYGVSVGAPGPPLYGGVFCGAGSTVGGTGIITIGNIPNLWLQTRSTGTQTCPKSVPVGGNCYTYDFGATGFGSCALNNAGQTVCRLSDRYIDSITSTTGPTYSTGSDNSTFGKNDTLLYFLRTGGTHKAALFNQANFVPGTTVSPFTILSNGGSPITIPGNLISPAATDPGMVYYLADGYGSNSAVTQMNLNGCISNPSNCIPITTVIYDLAAGSNCLSGTGYNQTVDMAIGISDDDTTIYDGMSNNQGTTGGQDTGTLIYAITTSGPPYYNIIGYGCRVVNYGAPFMAASLKTGGNGQDEQVLGPHANSATITTSGSHGTTVTATIGNFSYAVDNNWVIEIAGVGTVQASNSSLGSCTVSGGDLACVSILSGNLLPSWAISGTPVEIRQWGYIIGSQINRSNNCAGGAGMCFSLTSVLTNADANGCVVSCPYAYGALYTATYVNSTTLTVTPIGSPPFNGQYGPEIQTGVIYRSGIPPGYITGDWGPGSCVIGTGVCPAPITMSNCNGTGPCTPMPDSFSLHDNSAFHTHMAHSSATSGNCFYTSGQCGGAYIWQSDTTKVAPFAYTGHGNQGNQSIVHGLGGGIQSAFLPIIDANGNWAPAYQLGTTDIQVVNNNVIDPSFANVGTHAQWHNNYKYDTLALFESSDTSNISKVMNNNMNDIGCTIPYPLWTSNPSCSGNPFSGPLANEIFLVQVSQNPGGSPLLTQACGIVQMVGSNPTIVGNYQAQPGSSSATCSNHLSPNIPFPVYRLGPHYGTNISQIFDAWAYYLTVSQTGKYVMYNSDYYCLLGGSPTTLTGTAMICGGPDYQENNAYSSVNGDIITPLKNNASNYTYQASTSGTSSSSPPPWTANNICDNGSGSGGGGYTPPCASGVTWNYLGNQNRGADVFVVGTIPYSGQVASPSNLTLTGKKVQFSGKNVTIQ
jgi:hypothetical protein